MVTRSCRSVHFFPRSDDTYSCRADKRETELWQGVTVICCKASPRDVTLVLHARRVAGQPPRAGIKDGAPRGGLLTQAGWWVNSWGIQQQLDKQQIPKGPQGGFPLPFQPGLAHAGCAFLQGPVSSFPLPALLRTSLSTPPSVRHCCTGPGDPTGQGVLLSAGSRVRGYWLRVTEHSQCGL